MEALILYLVLFFPGIYSFGLSGGIVLTETISTVTARELTRIISYTLPSFVLLWYIIPEKKGFSALKQEKIRKPDFIVFSIGFPALVFIGLAISILISLFSEYGVTPPSTIETPVGVWPWIVVVFSCICTGYLEESYFRYYLLTKFENRFSGAATGIFFSSILFSLCHIYEGPWGFLNAALAGILLALLFIRYRSLHGIAWAHAAYNIFVYVVGYFSP